ncbi:MAG: hypothetical protein D6725_16805 [Planctomycetota bacterium]|nr:MAG: hypothetical protein D6725_16805 [Planctomycetota bacterium]
MRNSPPAAATAFGLPCSAAVPSDGGRVGPCKSRYVGKLLHNALSHKTKFVPAESAMRQTVSQTADGAEEVIAAERRERHALPGAAGAVGMAGPVGMAESGVKLCAERDVMGRAAQVWSRRRSDRWRRRRSAVTVRVDARCGRRCGCLAGMSFVVKGLR